MKYAHLCYNINIMTKSILISLTITLSATLILQYESVSPDPERYRMAFLAVANMSGILWMFTLVSYCIIMAFCDNEMKKTTHYTNLIRSLRLTYGGWFVSMVLAFGAAWAGNPLLWAMGFAVFIFALSNKWEMIFKYYSTLAFFSKPKGDPDYLD